MMVEGGTEGKGQVDTVLSTDPNARFDFHTLRS